MYFFYLSQNNSYTYLMNNKKHFHISPIFRSMYIIFLVLFLWVFLWTLGSYLVLNFVSQPSYTVFERRVGYEIRDYASMIVAEVEVTGSRREAMGQGFRLLADYIFGNNVTKKSVAMTSPVMDRASEKIAMTSPVMETKTDIEIRKVTFTMPSKYTLETLPTPNNTQVLLSQIPPKRMAVIRFSWWAMSGRFDWKTQTLLDALKRDGTQIIGTPIFASYNPPFSAPWMHRNEVMIEIFKD